MDYLFPVSGVETNILIPPLVALGISFFASMVGVSGAFLLLPFQMSVLYFTSPSVSATNFVFNIVAIPSGVYRYFREGRLAWPLAGVIVAGTLPGVFLGYFLRVRYLPDPRSFKLFVGLVLLYIGGRLLWSMTARPASKSMKRQTLDMELRQKAALLRKEQEKKTVKGGPAPAAVVKTISVSLSRVEYEFGAQRFSFSTPGMFALALIVGVIGGTYGIGGGAIIAPFCVAVFRLPVYTVAGAALLGTMVTSVAGVYCYSRIPAPGLSTAPDWRLGLLFGVGGSLGMYLGARCQRFVPQRLLKLGLGSVMIFLAASYVWQYF